MVQNNFFYVAKSEFWPFFLKSKEAGGLLRNGVADTEKGALFNQYVQEVSIETSAFCNRKCAYCPISKYPRKQQLMSEALYHKILDEMRQIDYRGIFTLSWFNEPLADKDIVNRVRLAKQYCPDSYVRFNSNGDYLTREFLDELNEAGLGEMLVTLHMNSGEKYTDKSAAEKLNLFFKKLGLSYSVTRMSSDHNISCDLSYQNIRFLVVTNNWETDGNDRGGEISALSISGRTAPCVTPFREIYIDVEGNMRFCCNIFVNGKSIADIRDQSIVDAFFSDEMVEIRQNLLVFGPKQNPCATCNAYDNASVPSKRKREELLLGAKA